MNLVSWAWSVGFVVVVSGSMACGGGGGGGSTPKDPTNGGESSSGKGGSGGGSDEASNAPPKKASKYPEPWLEPDCGTVGSDGYLPNAKAVVTKVHQDGWDKLKRCVADVSDVHGEVLVSFRLDPDGVPRCVEAPGSSMTNDDVVNCVVQVYRTFHYPSPQNGSVRVTDGIEFEVSETDDDD